MGWGGTCARRVFFVHDEGDCSRSHHVIFESVCNDFGEGDVEIAFDVDDPIGVVVFVWGKTGAHWNDELVADDFVVVIWSAGVSGEVDAKRADELHFYER